METIISYLDNLFRAYPDTEKVRKAKEELLGIMEDKYYELKAEGKSENEAIGIVISEFGSMDEIAFELGFEEEKTESKQTCGDDKESVRLSFDQAKEYLRAEEKFGIKIGIGVALCILSPCLSVIMDVFCVLGFVSHGIADSFGAVGLFCVVAAAVGILITSGMAHDKYDRYKKGRIILDSGTKTLLTEEFETYQPVFGRMIACGVILCILSVVPAILTEGFFGSTFFAWTENLSALSLFGFVAAGVYLFITAGIKQGAYETLLGTGGHSVKKKKKKDKWISIIASIYWPIVTAVYLSVSFVTMDWGRTWIIWPITGILFGGISAVISQLLNQEER